AVLHATVFEPVAFLNDGAHARRVVFDDRSCRVRVSNSPNMWNGCLLSAGVHRYRIVGSRPAVARGEVVTAAACRRVTLRASAPTVTYGETVTLRGTVDEEIPSPHEVEDVVTVFGRPAGGSVYRLRRVPTTEPSPTSAALPWRLTVRPGVG